MKQHTGRIVTGVGGFYDVVLDDGSKLQCKLRGRLRLSRQGVAVGDWVKVTAGSPGEQGQIEEVLPRKNAVPRPALANVDQMLAVMACASPPPNALLLDRILVLAEHHRIPPAICFNKEDLALDAQKEWERLQDDLLFYPVFAVSALEKSGLDELKMWLQGNVTALAGPSGVGKSALINALCPDVQLEVGGISPKLKRGRHTTRQVSLIALPNGGFVADTPGFSQLSIADIPLDELCFCFPEIHEASQNCPFRGCTHTNEANCAVKKAVDEGRISLSRYRHYTAFREEIQRTNRY